jgi:hypothetical protein
MVGSQFFDFWKPSWVCAVLNLYYTFLCGGLNLLDMKEKKMKNFIINLSLVPLMLFTLSSAAAVTIIRGEPTTVIEKEKGIYEPENTVIKSSDYYYLNVGGSKRICYREVRSDLETIGDISLLVGGSPTIVHCYKFSPDRFRIE